MDCAPTLFYACVLVARCVAGSRPGRIHAALPRTLRGHSQARKFHAEDAQAGWQPFGSECPAGRSCGVSRFATVTRTWLLLLFKV